MSSAVPKWFRHGVKCLACRADFLARVNGVLDRQNPNGGINAFVKSLVRPVFGQEILNFIELIPASLMVIRFSSSEKIYEELDNNNMGRVFAKSHGFRFKTV